MVEKGSKGDILFVPDRFEDALNMQEINLRAVAQIANPPGANIKEFLLNIIGEAKEV